MANKPNYPTYSVVAAFILVNGRFFAASRGYGELKGKWEFPGGKVKAGETDEAALIREIEEELDTEIEVENRLSEIEYDYPSFHLSMRLYKCHVVKGKLHTIEGIHDQGRFFAFEECAQEDWCPADYKLIQELFKAKGLFNPLQ